VLETLALIRCGVNSPAGFITRPRVGIAARRSIATIGTGPTGSRYSGHLRAV
jgi:hypothetical protein